MGKVKASDAVVRLLENWGINHIYGIPGDSIDTMVEALRKEESKIKFYTVRHEEVASLAAAAYSKLTGKIGVCLAIGGPGAIHLLNGMYDAKMDHVPMLVLVGHIPSRLTGTDYFQEVDTVELFKDVAVYNKKITSAESFPAVVNQAIRTAYTKRGVAVLSIPDDIPLGEISDSAPQLSTIFEKKTPGLVQDDLNDAVALINKATSPVILAGVGAKNAKNELKAFAERIDAPVAITLPGKGAISDLHPNFIGNIGKIGTKPAYRAMKSSDLLIMIGTDYPYAAYLPEGAKCVQIDIDPEKIGKRYAVTNGIVGDSAEALDYLTEHVTPVSDRPFLKTCQDNMKTWWNWMNEDQDQKKSPIAPEALMAGIESISEDDTIYSVDVGTSTVWSTRYLRLRENQDFIVSAWLGTMGCGLPGAIAAKQTFPDRQAIAITGDGAFAMVMQDFATAVHYKMPIIVVVLNNKQLAFIKYEQQSAGQLKYAVDFGDIDYAKFAEACGGKGFRIQNYEELQPALEQAKASDVPVILDVAVDVNAAPLPGKIVMDEAKGYARFTAKSIAENHKMEKMPPMKTVMRRFL
ncbi:pyruvate oxidase [Sporolactobacillus inulinus]|uniref:Pyruvate oxidase n=1 Tax=Sporolactobacillus inulinus CASD TaxID=1069536 RepID=A0A0U1QS97_9BACL|nr:pyruvate oxidase [Sporolactobacillus inulinus]KLI03673.1 pyruvate oxidase [Sporolactobacillus inulinus CASD]GEB75998.1 pyruvate oxidase [Sporolactobacillus inulinus]